MKRDDVDPASATAASADPSDQAPDEQRESHSFVVVGIGASAGGLEAFTQFLEHLPEKTGMAFVLVQHLDPKHESQLSDILAKATRLRVTEATDGTVVSPDHVYTIPPNTTMTIADGALHLTPRGESRLQHLPLDVFFRSLAQDRQSQAVGVILSGTGSDGSLGLAEIRAVGGITFAQDEKSAKYSAMPLNAVNSDAVDYVLPPDQIARELVRIGHDFSLSLARVSETGTESKEGLRKVHGLLRASAGVDFSQYRETTVNRRISRRMALNRKDTMGEYVQYLGENAAEVDALCRDILINVTSFFRNPEVFESLKTVVFPEIVNSKSADAPIRMWAPGCSTGQEAYSLAIVLIEFLDKQPMRPPIQIFGTDINDAASIEKARVGHYPAAIESEVSSDRLRRFFTREDGGYRIGKSIRDMCVFARQNVASDPPFSKLDLISCRNLLIYLSPPLQKRIIPTFHYALNPGGFLLLGAAESVGRFSDLFTTVDKKHSIYTKAASLVRPYPHFAADEYRPRGAAAPGPEAPRAPSVADMQKEADRIIMGRYAPASVLIDEDLEILQFRGRTGAYLEPASGEASLNLLRMAGEGLFLELRTAIDQAKKENASVRKAGIRLRSDRHQTRDVNVDVIPVRLPTSPRRCFLVLFEEATPPANRQAAAPAPPADVATDPALHSEIEHLHEELAAAKDYLQAVIEQQSAANEELKSANEEILSSNEELQSTNEELQTAKEELQSTNEELHTVNEELQCRNHELGLLNDDLSNTLSSVKIPIIILGSDLRIRRFTPAAGELLHLVPSDAGRPLRDISLAFGIPGLEANLLDAIATVAVKEQDVQGAAGRWYQLRMHPYRTADNRIDGVIMVFYDTTERRRAEELRLSKESAEADGRAKDRFLAVLSHELRTPLTPVLAAVSMMERDPSLPAEAQENLSMMRRNVELEATLIDDLLDVTRIATGKLELKVRTIDLRALLRATVDTCAADIQGKKLDVTLDVKNGPQFLRGDSARLQQIFWNLLKNATKFTPRGGRIALRTLNGSALPSHVPGTDCSPAPSEASCPILANADSRVQSVVIEVSDTGVGIEPDQLGRIFQAFEQGDRRVTREFGGLGLGLAICRTLVELHGGTIAAISPGKGRGTTFRVELPVCGPMLPCNCAGGGASGEADRSSAPSRKLHVLLVEDHADTAHIMDLLLQNDGHTVKVAHDVASALELAKHNEFDLMISDLTLPDDSGLELMRQLQTNHHKVKGIALSGHGMEMDVNRSREAGFVEHLTKPIDMDRLQAAISRAMDA